MQVSEQDRDFVDSSSSSPSRLQRRLALSFSRRSALFPQLLLAACTLAIVHPGASRAQDPLDQVQQNGQQQQPALQPGEQSQYPQYCTDQNPCTAPSAVGRDTDISPQPGQNSGQNYPAANRNQSQYGSGGNNQQDRNPSVAGYGVRSQTPPPPPPSEFQQIVAASTGRMLPIFGASMFNSVPSTFAPVDNIPVTPDYVIGPGDELRLQIWGQVNQHGSFIVDRTGSIALPEVGTIHVAGLQFSQLADFLKSQLGRVYRNFDLNVNLGQLRSIQVFVVGQARQPGSYTIGSLSTLLNALFASGGPLPQGSLRDIQVRRSGATVTHFDLYDLLLRGDKSKDVRLEPGDVIFIPDVGPQIAVTGSVNTPAIYELRDEKSVAQALALAGGLTNTAANSQLRVERIYNHTQRSMVAVDLASAGSATVENGDIISVDSILDRFKNAVTLRGNVANPGRYPWHEGMRISDLIPNREMLITRDYYQRLTALGQSAPQAAPPAGEGAIGIRASAATASQQAAPGGGVAGTSGGGSSVGSALTDVSGTFSPKNDVVLSAPDIDWEYAVIERQSATDLTTSLLPFNLGKAVIDKEPSQDLQLMAGDVVTIFSKADIRVPSAQQTKIVKLEGEFAGAGVYTVKPGENLRELVARAGGLTPNADLFASEFTRDSVRRVQKQRLLEFADELESQISANSTANASSALTDRDASAAAASAAEARAAVARLRQAQPNGRIVLPLKPDSAGADTLPEIALQDGDRFVVPRVPATVSVEGQVYNANAFLYVQGKRVKDYLHLAGGADRIGDRKREFVLRADGSVVSRQYGSFAQHALFADHDFDDVVLYPGDTIIVPPIIQKSAFLRNLSDVSTILEGFGLGAAAIQVLK